ncbi:DUF397 domain-containing protein [Streptomyces sp. NPDC079020]|uniref:DUF397 domain-containing protein n=1 Tax=unclassified Streptomyces TaxID=2593676 RepID=UPI002E79454B|nr:DUF397 domain-containing protein [Streptomyces sp. BE147]MEE1741454.1 DUF397 domain-containing protein [Streptomyces sp. BE147]
MRHEAAESHGAIDTEWRKSSYSGGQGNCLEVADNAPHLVPVRDSKRPTGPVITFSPDAWRAFISQLD